MNYSWIQLSTSQKCGLPLTSTPWNPAFPWRNLTTQSPWSSLSPYHSIFHSLTRGHHVLHLRKVCYMIQYKAGRSISSQVPMENMNIFFKDTNLKVPEWISLHPCEYYLRERVMADDTSACKHTSQGCDRDSVMSKKVRRAHPWVYVLRNPRGWLN